MKNKNIIDEELQHAKDCAYKEFEYGSMKEVYKKWPLCIPSRIRVRKILKEVDAAGGEKVVDMGCEAGFISRKLIDKGKYKVSSIDVCHTALEEFKKILEREGYPKEKWPDIRQLWLEFGMGPNPYDKTDYSSIKYVIGIEGQVDLSNFKLIRRYNILSLYEKKL